MRHYHVKFVHKISPKDTDTMEVQLPDNAFSNRVTLGQALRNAKVLGHGCYVHKTRVEGDKIIVFPICPNLTTYWHSITLTCED